MRGYESEPSPLEDQRDIPLFLPMRGYESLTLMEYLTEITLFLPMRGYEIINIRIDIRTVLVISPHEGL